MAGSVNKVILVGNIGNAPDIRATQDGRRIASLSIATSDSWKDKQTGERRERTEWHRVVIYNEALVGIVEKYARKGGKVFVEGALQTRKWQDKDGVERYVTEVVLQAYNGNITLLSKVESDDGHGDSDGYSRPAPARQNPETQQRARVVEAYPELDDEIPF